MNSQKTLKSIKSPICSKTNSNNLKEPTRRKTRASRLSTLLGRSILRSPLTQLQLHSKYTTPSRFPLLFADDLLGRYGKYWCIFVPQVMSRLCLQVAFKSQAYSMGCLRIRVTATSSTHSSWPDTNVINFEFCYDDDSDGSKMAARIV